MNLDAGLPGPTGEIHEHVNMSKDCETLFAEELDCLLITGNRLNVKETYLSPPSFRNSSLRQFIAYSFASTRLRNNERLHFSLILIHDQSDETDCSGVLQGDPEVIWANFGEMLIKIIFRMLSAYR